MVPSDGSIGESHEHHSNRWPGSAAPPLLQWDREDRRNPVSWYFYHGASDASWFSLQGGAWVSVLGITPKPSSWQEGFAYQGEGVAFILDGARDQRNDSLGLFPETLRADLHGVRATIEAHSRSRKLQPAEGALATGLMFPKGDQANRSWSDVRLRVTRPGSVQEFRLDRWD